MRSRENVSRSCKEWVRQMGTCRFSTAGQLTFASHPISLMTNHLGRCFTCTSMCSCCSRLLVVSSRKTVMSFVARVTDMHGTCLALPKPANFQPLIKIQIVRLPVSCRCYLDVSQVLPQGNVSWEESTVEIRTAVRFR
ncbi:hypothetical protein CEXT_767951 [Caerostris extrusa]|uniref:Uncharacterized protein n=1 Tax=Caerostris extrusa TaxID=172846 RepID=A0AAV4VAV0_CAEEX|nr:hypothetical protein CEXT_767951 [Caerostris extrusa]